VTFLAILLCTSVSCAAPLLRPPSGFGVSEDISSLPAACLPVSLDLDARYDAFAAKSYCDFQISDGFGGSAQDEAAAVFMDPFVGTDLAMVPFEVFDALKVAGEKAMDAEIELFNPAIAAVDPGSSEGLALDVGKWKNRVLYATANFQVERIKKAKLDDIGLEDPWGGSKYSWYEEYFLWAIEADRRNKGRPSLSPLLLRTRRKDLLHYIVIF